MWRCGDGTQRQTVAVILTVATDHSLTWSSGDSGNSCCAVLVVSGGDCVAAADCRSRGDVLVVRVERR